MRNLACALFALAMPLAGCIEVDVTMLRARNGIVEGDPDLFAANVMLHGELIDPFEVHEPDKVGEVRKLSLEFLTVEVLPDELEGLSDRDDLQFIYAVEVYIEPTAEDSELEGRLIAWFHRSDGQEHDPQLLELDIDRGIDVKPYVEEGCRFVFSSITAIPADDIAIRVEAGFIGPHDIM